MMKLYIALCDDEPITLADEARLVSDILNEKKLEYDLKTFRTPQELLDSEIIYDLVFLDIEMNDMNGIDLAKKISEKKRNCFIFFITNYSIYLDRAFDVNAIRYLTKPVDADRLSAGIDSALERMAAAMKTISVTNFKNKLTVDLEVASIIYISNTGRHTQIITTQYEFEADEIFSVVKNMIEKEVNYFATPHQSYYVNLKYVKSYTRMDVKMSYAGNTYEALMTRRRYKDFDKRIFEMAKDMR